MDEEGDDVAEVAVLDVERGDPQAGAEGGEEGEEDEDGQQDDLPAGHEAVPDHHADQDDEADEEIDEGDNDGSSGDDQPREVDLGDEVGVAHQAIGGIGQSGGEEGPRQHAGKDHQGVGGGALAGELGDLAEDDGENHHGQEGPDQRPGDADDGLFVADRNVAPGEDLEELPVVPEVAPVVLLGAAGFEDGFHGEGQKWESGNGES